MKHFQHKSNNGVLGAPQGWNQSETPCGALPVTKCLLDGKPAMKSYWRPSEEEIRALVDGHHITLLVLGTVHPPVAIGVEE